MKLELKHLAPYLPYGVAYNYTNSDRVSVLTSDVIARREKLRTLDKIRPILRPLSDLTKEIEHNGKTFVPLYFWDDKDRISLLASCATEVIYIEYLEYFIFEQLIEWHFDVFGLIDAGLAIERE